MEVDPCGMTNKEQATAKAKYGGSFSSAQNDNVKQATAMADKDKCRPPVIQDDNFQRGEAMTISLFGQG